MTVQPLFLLADSRPLFRTERAPALAKALEYHAGRGSRAAYVGASNGDAPEFCDMFVAAMTHSGVRDCSIVSSSFSKEDRRALEHAGLVVLAGGDVAAGWRVFERTGMKAAIEGCYRTGATIIGVSAGAVQLGNLATLRAPDDYGGWLPTFGLCPFLVDVHDEGRDWRHLAISVSMLGGATEGFGIPAGGGLVYSPDGIVVAQGECACRFVASPGGTRREVLHPNARSPTSFPSRCANPSRLDCETGTSHSH